MIKDWIDKLPVLEFFVDCPYIILKGGGGLHLFQLLNQMTFINNIKGFLKNVLSFNIYKNLVCPFHILESRQQQPITTNVLHLHEYLPFLIQIFRCPEMLHKGFDHVSKNGKSVETLSENSISTILYDVAILLVFTEIYSFSFSLY